MDCNGLAMPVLHNVLWLFFWSWDVCVQHLRKVLYILIPMFVTTTTYRLIQSHQLLLAGSSLKLNTLLNCLDRYLRWQSDYVYTLRTGVKTWVFLIVNHIRCWRILDKVKSVVSRHPIQMIDGWLFVNCEANFNDLTDPLSALIPLLLIVSGRRLQWPLSLRSDLPPNSRVWSPATRH